jgi:hypothetical protein
MHARRRQPVDEEDFLRERFIDMQGEVLDCTFQLVTPEKEAFASVIASDRC